MEQEALMLEMQKTRELLSQLIAAVGDDKASRSGVELEAETAAHDLHVIHVPHETMEKCPRTAQVASPDALVLGICQGLSTPNCNGQEQMKVGMCEALNTRNADLQTALMNIDMQRPLVEDSWCNDSGDVLAFGQRQVCSAKAKPRPRPLSLTQPDPLVYRMVPLPMPEGFDVSNIEGRSRSSSPAPRSLLRSWLGSGLYFESEAKVG